MSGPADQDGTRSAESRRTGRPLVGRLLRPLGVRGLAARFAAASAGLAAVAMLIMALTAWWMIERQQRQARIELVVRERQFQAERLAGALAEVEGRMQEIAASTILATGLVDTAGKETYLVPFLNGVRQIDGIPLHLVFADFQGQEIASNNFGRRFDATQRGWLREQLVAGRAAAAIFGEGDAAELVALEPMRYARTLSPEGAVFYKLSLSDFPVEPGLRLLWGAQPDGEPGAVIPVSVPARYASLSLRVGGTPPQGQRWPTERPYLLAALITATMALAVFIAGKRLAHRLTHDLSSLEAFSREVVVTGIAQHRAPEGSSTEVASLSRSINEMLDRLDGQNRALRAEGRKLEDLAQALRAADRRKDEFLAMLAHELRNPLSPISTGAELLARSSEGDGRVRRTAEVIARQVRHMRKLVDDLLDVSRVTRGLVTLERVPVDIAAMLHAACEQVRPQIEQRKQALHLHEPAVPLVVLGDDARLVQVIANLLHNACKYTPPGGQIHVSVREDGEDALVEVRDNGRGIDPEFMPELFGLFAQARRNPDRQEGGLGLGLPLARQLVELHGGRIDAYSAGLHAGATFTVRLPLHHGEPAAPVPPSAPGAQRQGALRVLVVDDNVDAALTLASLLEVDGHSVTIAHDASAALQLAPQTQADAYVLDIGLPGMDGIELAQHLRRLPGVPADTLFVALTGYGQAADRERSLRAGFDHHLVKPVDPQTLAEVLAQAGRRRADEAAGANPPPQAFNAA